MNEMLNKVLNVLLLIGLGNSVRAREFMTEKPDFLTPCAANSSDFNNCYRDNLQRLLANWKDGGPGLSAAGQLDPLRIKRMRIAQNQLVLQMKNISIEGLSAVNITGTRIDLKNNSFMANATVAKLRAEAHYKTAGRVLVLPLNGHGRMWLKAENINFTLTLRGERSAEKGLTFVDVQSVRCHIRGIGNLQVHLDNLFNGNKELEANTEAIFNENWRAFLDPLLPTVEQTIDAVALKRLKRVFNHIPLDYFVANLPTHSDEN